jgi:hypothetical protein
MQIFQVRVEKRSNDIVNRLNKTKVVDDEVDYRADREARDAQERQKEVCESTRPGGGDK